MQFSYKKKAQAVRNDAAAVNRMLDEKRRKGESFLFGKGLTKQTQLAAGLGVVAIDKLVRKFKKKKKN